MSGRISRVEQFVVDGIPIEVSFKAIKRSYLRVGRDGQVRMSVPQRASGSYIEGFAGQNLGWVRSQLKRREAAQEAQPTRDNADGELVSLWGEAHLVRCEVGPASAWLEGGDIVVRSPHGADRNTRAKIIHHFYIGEMKRELGRLLDQWQPIVGKRVATVQIKAMVSRWGSCTPQTARISLNVELAKLDPNYVEVVLLHEMAHLWVPHHGPEFVQLMDRWLPSWRERRRCLNNYRLR